MAPSTVTYGLKPARRRFLFWSAEIFAPLLCAHMIAAEQITMTTWYPAPVGVYQSLVTTGGSPSNPVNTILSRDAGNVGIGTGRPLSALQVSLPSPAVDYGSISNFNQGIIISNSVNSDGLPIGIQFGNLGNTFSGIFGVRTYSGGATQGDVVIANRPNGDSSTMTPNLIVKNNGNVGIGTTSPSSWAKLEVAGALSLSARSPGGLNVAVMTSEASGLPFLMKARPGDYPDFVITPSGYVGVGTLSPQDKLDVEGPYAARFFSTISNTGLRMYTNQIYAYDSTGNAIPLVLGGPSVLVGGSLQVNGAKNFNIRHPSKRGYRLVHSSLEGPEIAVFYRGKAQLAKGEAVIALPDYFESLTRKDDRTVQLTCVGGYSALYVDGDVAEGRFTVKSIPSGNPAQRFYWEVKAVRKDLEPLTVEEKDVFGDWAGPSYPNLTPK